jgi:TetR/AcrR family transcriptional repressor of mexJK operon
VRTWAADDPKAAMMARKRDAIINAALLAFLEDGYAGSSVNRIAAQAGVAITTLYRHFDNKDDLFIAVIQAACAAATDTADPRWLDLPPLEGLTEAGSAHLRFVLSADQLALYRVVTRESQRFPQLGQRYQSHVVEDRIAQFIRYLDRWPAALRAKISDPSRAARVSFALLQADLLEVALHAGPIPGPAELRAHAHDAAVCLLDLVESGRI